MACCRLISRYCWRYVHGLIHKGFSFSPNISSCQWKTPLFLVPSFHWIKGIITTLLMYGNVLNLHSEFSARVRIYYFTKLFCMVSDHQSQILHFKKLSIENMKQISNKKSQEMSSQVKAIFSDYIPCIMFPWLRTQMNCNCKPSQVYLIIQCSEVLI